MRSPKCPVCANASASRLLLCEPCRRAYNRWLGWTRTTLDTMEWAARRARRAEQKRRGAR
jgi:hypothetical protein